MKSALISLAAATALTLGACAHTADDTAALSADQLRAELAEVTKELAEVNAMAQEDQRRATAQNRASSMALGVGGRAAGSDLYGRSFEGPMEVRPVNASRRLVKQERLVERYKQLRAQLAAVTQPQG